MNRGAAHRPVLREEVLDVLSPGGRTLFVDCTVGLAGHAEALLEAAGGEARLIAIDADEGNLRLASQRLERFSPRVRFFHANFADLDTVLAKADAGPVDALLADLGVASNQFDDPSRGMSFLQQGPLDMRMNLEIERTAADLVNALGEQELADLIYRYGEDRYSRRIARAIVTARRGGRIETTAELARILTEAYPAPARRSRRGVHPATRTFQALRIAVNDELGSLERLLELLPGVLGPGGRAAIISFHSLEDRRVKRAFADWAATGRAKVLTRKPLVASERETQDNPRSRSAKLRGIERIAVGQETSGGGR